MRTLETDIELQRLGLADAERLSNLAVKTYADHYLHLWHDGGLWYINTHLSTARFEAELQDSNACFYLVYYKKAPVGFLKLNVHKPLPGEIINALELERIYLSKAATGHNIGTQLVQFSINLAKENRCEKVWLKVMDSSNAAIRFYEKCGFEITGTHTLPFEQMIETYRGMYIMQLSLQSKSQSFI
ncbi:MAG TPA: GNAT family N-acetyltransferase [Chitinophagaceae bacterium]|nr:GNAT family N-acetyltransferase [Chitinophagaceae bacterium]